MTTADVDGIEIAGLLFDAGPSELRRCSRWDRRAVASAMRRTDHSARYFSFAWAAREIGRAKVNLRINSNDTLVDHTWIWRADHGKEWAGI